MNKRYDFTQLGGFPVTQDRLAFMQDSYRNAFGAIAKIIGDYSIMTGVEVDNTNALVSDGWIIVQGELMPFVGGSLSSGVVVLETAENLSFFSGDDKTVQFTKYAQCGSPATFPFSNLKAPQTLRDTWITGDLKQVKCDNAYIAGNFDSNGNGINERVGWKICKEMRGRFPVGYDDRSVQPVGVDWWDVVYNTVMSTGGAKAVGLAITNIPAHDHGEQVATAVNGGGRTPAGYNGIVAGSYGPTGFKTEKTGGDPASGGAAAPHENRPPFVVILFIEKI